MLCCAVLWSGEIIDIERTEHSTEVLVDEGIHIQSYALDNALIYFQAALEVQDWERAVQVRAGAGDGVQVV